MTFAFGDFGAGIALDESTNMLYVGGANNIHKLKAGGTAELPTYLNTLTIDNDVDGFYMYGMALDTKAGYGMCKNRR